MRSAVVWVCLVGLVVGAVGDIIQNPPELFQLDPQSTAAPCTEQLESSGTQLGAFVPQCDGAGQYEPLQCHGSTGYCWCVDTAGARISAEFRAPDEDASTAEDCVALRQERLEESGSLGVTPRAPGGAGAEDDENGEKLGLVFVLAFASLVVLPASLAFVLRRACAKADQSGSRTSLVEESKGELDDGSDVEEHRGRGGSSDATKSETAPHSRPSRP